MATRISTAEAEKMLDDAVVYVDVRTEQEFGEGHVPGSVNVPVQFSTPEGAQPNGDFVSVISANFAKDQKLIVGCKAGSRSARAARLLEEAGFERVYEMSAGFSGSKDPFGRVIMGWQQEGREIETRSETEDDQTYAGMQRLADDRSSSV